MKSIINFENNRVMTNICKVFNVVALLLIMSTFNSCVDTDFDEPEVRFSVSDDQILSVADVLEFLPGLGSVQLTDELLGSDELYVSGIVTSDDTEGNFFKAVYFQDETGGLVIEPDQNELNAAYPRGHIVYVKLNNLFLLRDSNVPKLAFAQFCKLLQQISNDTRCRDNDRILG